VGSLTSHNPAGIHGLLREELYFVTSQFSKKDREEPRNIRQNSGQLGDITRTQVTNLTAEPTCPVTPCRRFGESSSGRRDSPSMDRPCTESKDRWYSPVQGTGCSFQPPPPCYYLVDLCPGERGAVRGMTVGSRNRSTKVKFCPSSTVSQFLYDLTWDNGTYVTQYSIQPTLG
jgi:hypothetical protein